MILLNLIVNSYDLLSFLIIIIVKVFKCLLHLYVKTKDNIKNPNNRLNGNSALQSLHFKKTTKATKIESILYGLMLPNIKDPKNTLVTKIKGKLFGNFL